MVYASMSYDLLLRLEAAVVELLLDEAVPSCKDLLAFVSGSR